MNNAKLRFYRSSKIYFVLRTFIMTKPKAINRKKLVAFVLTIIAKGVDPMLNEKLEKLKHEQYVAERKLTAAKHK